MKLKAILLLVSILLPISLFAANIESGKTKFQTTCSPCHGPEGLGDGPTAAALPEAMKPRNLQTGAMKVATDDAKFKELIKKGGPAFGLNPLMAPQGSILTDTEIDDIIAYVNSIRK
ncbi:MAG: cytochrome c [Bdellovibrionota bacterium]